VSELKPHPSHSAGSVTVNRGESDVAASYTRALHLDSSLAADSHAHLTRAQREHGLELQERYLCNVLRPRFIQRQRADELTRISSTLAHLMERLGHYLLSWSAGLDLVGASDQEQELWAVHPGYDDITVTSRLDSFMVGGVPRFVEYNAESPASIGFCDCLTEIFEQSPGMLAWAERHRLSRFRVREALLTSLLQAYRDAGGTGTPNVAIVDWDNVLTKRDFELCAEYFREVGITTVITDPRLLEYRGGHVYCGDQRIDLVYRRVLLHELLDRAEEAAPLLQAYADGAVCMVNSPRSKLLHKKSIFALLSEGVPGFGMSPEERAVVDLTIPWTRLLRDTTTTYGGENVELVALLESNRERFALKPVDDYGGRGVILGWDTDENEWARGLESALRNRYVVQERVTVPHGDFPIWDSGSVRMESMLVDTDPLLFYGEVAGILTRISSDQLLNVSAGTGSTTPTFVFEEEQ
jgi:hypothetical protein